MEGRENQVFGGQLQQRVFDALNAHIAVVDTQGRIIAVNRAWLQFAKANSANTMETVSVGANYLEVCRRAIATGDPGVDETLKGIESVLRGGRGLFAVDYPCHSHSEERWFTMMVVPLGNGGINGAVISHRNITAVKKAELALRESEERFRIVAENARGVIGIVQGKRFVYANPYMAEISGYSVEEILSMDFVEMVHPDHRQQVSENARRRLLGEPAPTHYEFGMVTKSGETRWMDFAPGLSHYRGRPAIVGTAFDVTERKQAETALRVSEERLRLAQQVGHVGVFDCDMQTDEVVLTPELREILGLPESACESRFPDWSQLVHPEDLPRLDAYLDDWLASKREIGEMEYRILRCGKVRWLSGRGQVYFDSEGNPLRLIGTVLDITERKEAEIQLADSLERLYKLQEQLRQKERFATLGQLAGSVAHEIRSPLTVLLNGVEFLEHALPAKGESMQEMLAEMRRAIGNSNRVITEMLDYVQEPLFEGLVFPIGEAISQAIQLIPPPRGVHLQVPEPLNAATLVKAEPHRVARIFVNLIENAYQAMPNGGELHIKVQRENGENVCIEVQDTGFGIPKANLEKIFEPLFSTKVRGIGLGLAIARRYAQLCGGQLSVESKVGQGTTFRLILNAAP